MFQEFKNCDLVLYYVVHIMFNNAFHIIEKRGSSIKIKRTVGAWLHNMLEAIGKVSLQKLLNNESEMYHY